MSTRKLAAAYVLEELHAAERAEVERRLDRDSELRTEVDACRALAGRLEALPGDAWPPGEESTLAPAPGAPREGHWSVRPSFALACLAAALLFGGALGALLRGSGDGGSGPSPVAVVLRPLGAGSKASASVRMPRPGTMEMNVRGLAPTARGQYYELWLMSSPRRTVPVVSFSVGEDGSARVRVPLPADPRAYRYFDVSRQLASEGTSHSDQSVLRGQIRAS
jgi:anti-sigma-K factor RskA